MPESAQDHIKNNAQFISQKNAVVEEPFPTTSHEDGSQYWHGGEVLDRYEHQIGTEKRTVYKRDPENWGSGETEDIEVPMSNATLTVKHHGAQGSTEYRPQEGGSDRANFDFYQKSENRRTGQIEGQTALFKHKSSQPYSEVYYMQGTKGGRVANMTQLGMAANDTYEKYGRQLTPADDLSKNSEHLVDRLEERGVTKKADRVHSNAIDFEPRPYVATPSVEYHKGSLSEGQFTPESAENVAAGRDTVRQLLGGTKKKKGSPGEQLSLLD